MSRGSGGHVTYPTFQPLLLLTHFEVKQSGVGKKEVGKAAVLQSLGGWKNLTRLLCIILVNSDVLK